MAAELIGVGAQVVSAIGGDPLSPAYPAGYTAVAGDVCFWVYGARHQNAASLLPPTPTGFGDSVSVWTDVLSTPTDAELTVFRKVLTASEALPSITIPAAYNTFGLSAQVVIVRGQDAAVLDVAAVTSGTSTAALTFTPTGVTTVTDGALVISIALSSDDNALGMLSGSTQSFSLNAGGIDYDTATGGDHAIGIASRVVATLGAVTCPTWEQTVGGSDAWAAITFAIRPASAGSEVSGGATLDGVGASGTLEGPNNLTGSATLDGMTAAGGMDGPNSLTGDAALDGPSAGGGASGASTPGTLTSSRMVFNNDAVHSNVPLEAFISVPSTGAFVLRKTGLTSTTSSTAPVCAFNDAALTPGAQYRVTWRRTDTGAEGTELLTAT